MDISNLKYKIKTAPCQNIVEHLNQCVNCFNPPLNTYVEIDKYGKKIFDSATTFESWEGNKLVGLLAVYFNNTETKIGFITNVSVLKEYQGSGIATKLIKSAIDFGRKNAFIKLMLEININNTKASKLYKKHGFIVVGKNKNNIIMNKEIK